MKADMEAIETVEAEFDNKYGPVPAQPKEKATQT